MNEQVKAIMIKHGLHKYITEDCQSRMNMLAKLIVEECCDLITKNEHSMVPGFMQRMSAYAEVSMLRKHFGLDNE